MDQVTPTKDEIKLIMDNSNLALEARITEKIQKTMKDFGDTITSNNKMYLDHIVDQENRLTKVENDVRVVRNRQWVFGSVGTALGGILGFFVSQLVTITGKH